MDPNRYTVKSREAIDRTQRIARERSHQELRPEHLLAALLQESEGTVSGVLQKLGVSARELSTAVDEALGALPRVQGGGSSLYLGEALRETFERAEAHLQQRQRGDGGHAAQ